MLDQVLIVIGITVLIMISPGPDMVIVMKNTFIGGKSAGMSTSVGILTGNLVHISYCAIGIGVLISQSIVLFNMLKYASAAYLIYLGVTSWMASKTTLQVSDAPRDGARRGWFMQGFVNNILNPKGTMFYLSVFTLVITPDTSTGVVLLLVAIMMSISAAFWVFFVYTLDTRVVRKLLERAQTLVNRVFGVLLVMLGLRVAFIER